MRPVWSGGVVLRGIGGNTDATFQVCTVSKNAIGEQVETWVDVQTIHGWLDLSGGDSRYMTFSAKVQESTHVFVADYVSLDSRIKAENARMVVNGNTYDVMLIDNPMGLQEGSQLEIFLKYTGGR